jgi:hypothetical protein
MDNKRTTGKTDAAAEKVIVTIGRLGEATAATIAAEAEVAYSTTNKKPRSARSCRIEVVRGGRACDTGRGTPTSR